MYHVLHFFLTYVFLISSFYPLWMSQTWLRAPSVVAFAVEHDVASAVAYLRKQKHHHYTHSSLRGTIYRASSSSWPSRGGSVLTAASGKERAVSETSSLFYELICAEMMNGWAARSDIFTTLSRLYFL